MATDSTDIFPTATVATGLGLFVTAGLGAIYAYYANTYTQPDGFGGRSKDGKEKDEDGGVTTRTKPREKGGDESFGGNLGVPETGRAGRKARKRGKGGSKGNNVEVGVDDSERESKRNGEIPDAVAVPTIPGDFEGLSAVLDSARVDELAPNRTNSKQTKKKKRADKAKAKKEQGNVVEDEDEEGKSACGPRAGDSTDASVSFFPSRSLSIPTSASASSFPAMKSADDLRTSTAKLVIQSVQPQSQAGARPRRTRSSSLFLSLDTDGSWTHIDNHRLVEARPAKPTAVADVTSSDLASTASESPAVERMSGSALDDVRGIRADVEQLTLAAQEKLVAKLGKTGVDSMLVKPDFPTPARVMRVRPRLDDAPVPGFSWDDYGDIIEDQGSFRDTDADQEDEGEWGIVKSRSSRSGPALLKSGFASTSPAAAGKTAGSSSTMTKKQRQNARKRELAKGVKLEAEAERLDGLARHKRELERLHIIEQSQRSGGGKRPSGGMHAAVDERGKLVWE